MSITAKRTLDMAAVFMIGDGLLGIVQPMRHVDLWLSDVPAADILVRPFAGKPGRRRAYGILQVAAGLALAATLVGDRGAPRGGGKHDSCRMTNVNSGAA